MKIIKKVLSYVWEVIKESIAQIFTLLGFFYSMADPNG